MLLVRQGIPKVATRDGDDEHDRVLNPARASRKGKDSRICADPKETGKEAANKETVRTGERRREDGRALQDCSLAFPRAARILTPLRSIPL